MRIRIWNAYASNNSGSYTIVGSFKDAQRASEVAGELAAVIAAHDRWVHRWAHEPTMPDVQTTAAEKPPASALERIAGWVGAGKRASASDDDTRSVHSPLRLFARTHGLNQELGVGEDDDWPEYGEPTCPTVASAGNQVLIHSRYTVSLPPLFGEFFHKRGGRVELELDHAHAPIAVVFEIRWPRSPGVPVLSDDIRSALRDELMQPEGVIAVHAAAAMTPQAWTPNDSHSDLCIAAVLKDLVAGVAETSAVIRRAGADHHLRLHELDATSATLLGSLRPPEPD